MPRLVSSAPEFHAVIIADAPVPDPRGRKSGCPQDAHASFSLVPGSSRHEPIGTSKGRVTVSAPAAGRGPSTSPNTNPPNHAPSLHRTQHVFFIVHPLGAHHSLIGA